MNLMPPPLLNKAAIPCNERMIGAILIDTGHLSADNVERIMHLKNTQGKRFGDAAIELGLLNEEEVNYALSSQFDYPYLPADDTRLSPDLVAAFKPFSPFVEQLRALRSQLMLRWFGVKTHRKCLAVVSAGPGDGRSYITANLAVVFSQLGTRTLLIDADLRTPQQHKLFKLDNGGGLSGLLAGRANENAAVLKIPSLLSLSVLPAGAVPPNPQELLGRPAFTEILQTLSADFDVILIDTPAAHQNADAQTIAARAGAALLLARKNCSTIRDIDELTHNLQDAGTVLVGSILNSI